MLRFFGSVARSLIVAALLGVVSFTLPAQQGQVSTPSGSSLSGTNGEVHWSSYSVEEIEKVWRPPPGRTIATVGRKVVREKADDYYRAVTFYILLDDGSVYSIHKGIEYLNLFAVEYRTKLVNVGSGSLRQVFGDAIYGVSFTTVFVSRDDGLTWEVDTLGLNGAAPKQVTIDTLQNVYLATDKGLFTQTLNGTTWQPVSSMTKSLNAVFIDRRDTRLYVGTASEGIYKSTNLGTTWQPDTAGSGTLFVSQFAEDAADNIYARGSGNIYRSSGGTQPWVRIDQGLRSKTLTQFISITGISGDSDLTASTSSGLFKSTDFGETWTEANDGLQSDNAYGYLKLPSGRTVVTTDLGIYYQNSGSTIWTRAYPVGLVDLFQNPIQRDNSGALYTSNSSSIFKSADDGTTWTVDNPGWVSPLPVQPGSLYVDENGVQHFYPGRVNISFVPNTYIYLKSGGNWVADQTGLTFAVGERVYGYASDRSGNLFLFRSSSANPSVTRRAIGGGTWSADVTGLNGKNIISMVRDRNGEMIGGAFGGGIFRRVNGTWTSIPVPAAVSSSHVTQLSVDSTGALFAVFSDDDPTFPFQSRGVYFTKDNGVTWTLAGLDSVGVRSLVSHGDSTFALTIGRGVQLLRSTPVAFLQASTSDLPFANVTISQPKNLSFSVMNTGTAALTISSITSSNAAFVPQTTQATLGAQQTILIAIRFTPSSAVDFIGSVVLVSNSSSSPDTIRVAGRGVAVSAVEQLEGLPTEFSLSQNYPNPFNPVTSIQYAIPQQAHVRLDIYNLLGQRVAMLVNEEQQPAFYQAQWNGAGFASGMYYYRIEAGSFVQTRKLLLLK